MPLYDQNASVLGMVVPLGDTFQTSGSVTAPTIGQAIATIAAPGAGVYRVQARLVMSGTAETAVLNAELRHGANVGGKVGFTALAAVQQITEFERVTVLGGEAITVNATAGAAAGSVYTVILTAVRIG